MRPGEAVGKMNRRIVRFFTVLAAVSLPGTGFADKRDPDVKVRIIHEYFWAGFPIAQSDTTIDIVPGRYDIASVAETLGAISLLYDTRIESKSGGILESGGAQPATYRSESVFNGKERSIRMTYGEDGRIDLALTPEVEDDERDPVPESLWPDTVDPLSAFMAAGLAGQRGEACSGQQRVFDGRRRYDLIFTNTGTESLEATGFSIYGGEAIRCEVLFKRVAGFRRDYLEEEPEDPPPVVLWLAPFDKGRISIPVRFEAEAFFGTVWGGVREMEVEVSRPTAE